MKIQQTKPSLPAIRCLGALIMLLGAGIAQADQCPNLIQAFGSQLADVSCVDSADLTTANPATTPANNSLPGLPPFAFTPQSDRATIAPDAANRTPISGPVPGVQLNARIASDPTGQARFLLRLPANWNGRLVVAGASGTRSEFNGDFAWSDYVVQKGYAYASQNKGVLNLKFSDASDPLACRLNPASALWVHFYDNDPGQEFTRWRDFMVLASKLAHKGAAANYGKAPRYTYAVGTSNGGYQVRRAVESAPEWFDGGVDWEGTFVDANGPNLLTICRWPRSTGAGGTQGLPTLWSATQKLRCNSVWGKGKFNTHMVCATMQCIPMNFRLYFGIAAGFSGRWSV